MTEYADHTPGRRGETGSDMPHVVIIGAGLAGLCAAYQLQQKGCSYTLLEAEEKHIGGRVHTHDFGNGLHGELGAMRIPKQHTITMKYVVQFALAHRPFVMTNPNTYFYARGTRVREGEEHLLAALYNLRPSERHDMSDALWSYAVLRHLTGLTDEEKTELSFADVFRTKKVSDFDKLSLRGLIDRSGLSDEAIEYLLVAYADQTLEHTASTEHLREELTNIWSQPDFCELVGGTRQLPEAFKKRLHTPLRMGCQVVRIEQDDRHATAVFKSDGKQDRVQGDFVLCTIPLPVLARLDLPFSGEKMRAIHDVWYEAATKVLVPTSTRFWETDPTNPIFGGGTYTDLMTGSIYYPSDNATDRDPNISKGPGVLIASYCWGQDARRLGAMSETERAKFAIDQVSKVHPELKNPGVVLWDQVQSKAWEDHPWSGGAFAFYMPGQFSSLHHIVIRPEGRVYFAGEHCSHSHTWMQGALESAETAVDAILQAWQQH